MRGADLGPSADLRGVAFDFDGTILDTESADHRSMSELWSDHGIELPMDRWLAGIGALESFDWLGELEARLGRPLDRQQLLERRWTRTLALIEQEVPRPGVLALLDSCDERGVAVAVASNAPLAWVEGHLGRLGLRARFAAVVCADQVAAPKPAPDVYLAAVDALGCELSEAVAVEDSPFGVAAAKAAGLVCLGVHGALSGALDLSAADRELPTLEGVLVDDLAELLAVAGTAGRTRS